MNALTAPSPHDQPIYLDHAATTPVHPAVVDKMLPYMSLLYGNPSSLHPLGSAVRSDIEKARRCIQTLLRAEDGHIFFTSGGTEANNWAISGIMRAHPIRHVITSRLEHSSVLAAVDAWKTKGVTCTYVPVNSQGVIDYRTLEGLLEGRPKTLVSLMHGNNEIGNMTDVAYVASLCRKHGALLHSDMVQTVGHYPIDLSGWGVDLCTGSAHKFYGPKGIGFLYVREGVKIAPLMYGGKQERGARGATEHVAGIVGMAAALNMMHEHRDRHHDHITGVKRYMIKKLRAHVPDVRFHGQCQDMNQSLRSILNVGLPRADKETLFLQLAIKGIAVSSGSACMSGAKVGSHVLHALQVPDAEANVRFSLGIDTTFDEVDYVIKCLVEMCGA